MAIPGDYVKDIALEIQRQHGDQFLAHDQDEAVTFFREYGGDALLHTIRAQLRDFGIAFDSFFSEKAMRERGEVDRAISELRSKACSIRKTARNGIGRRDSATIKIVPLSRATASSRTSPAISRIIGTSSRATITS